MKVEVSAHARERIAERLLKIKPKTMTFIKLSIASNKLAQEAFNFGLSSDDLPDGYPWKDKLEKTESSIYIYRNGFMWIFALKKIKATLLTMYPLDQAHALKNAEYLKKHGFLNRKEKK